MHCSSGHETEVGKRYCGECGEALQAVAQQPVESPFWQAVKRTKLVTIVVIAAIVLYITVTFIQERNKVNDAQKRYQQCLSTLTIRQLEAGARECGSVP